MNKNFGYFNRMFLLPAENDGGKISLLEYDAENKTAKCFLQGAYMILPKFYRNFKRRNRAGSKKFLPDLVEK